MQNCIKRLQKNNPVQGYFKLSRSISNDPSINSSPSATTMVGIPTLPLAFTSSKYGDLSLIAKKIFKFLILSVILIYSNSISFFKSNSLKGSHSGHRGLPKTVNVFFIFFTPPKYYS